MSKAIGLSKQAGLNDQQDGCADKPGESGNCRSHFDH